ncbi:MAG: helix-turn-helix domain-containing protein [Nocardioidaceae bacterium]|nr:helix-turn-helix domain-containing protein [Nocardioidaceae bacterium]
MVDVREAAALAARTPETIRRWVWSGRLPARRRGRRLIVARDDVLRLVGASRSDGAGVTLQEWAQEASAGPAGSSETASDLVFDDRAARDEGVTNARRP